MKTNKIINIIKDNWLQITFWIITCILLIVVIAIFVSWQTSMNEKIFANKQNKDGKDLYNLTSNAIKQQNIVAALAFGFVVSLSISIFVTVFIAYKNKKRRLK